MRRTVLTGKVEPFHQANAGWSSFHLERGRFIADILREFNGKRVTITIEETNGNDQQDDDKTPPPIEKARAARD